MLVHVVLSYRISLSVWKQHHGCTVHVVCTIAVTTSVSCDAFVYFKGYFGGTYLSKVNSDAASNN